MKLSGDATVDTISFRKPDWISRHPVLKRSQRYSFSFFFSSAAERRKAYRRTAIPVQRNNKTLLEFWSGQVALPSSKQWAQVPPPHANCTRASKTRKCTRGRFGGIYATQGYSRLVRLSYERSVLLVSLLFPLFPWPRPRVTGSFRLPCNAVSFEFVYTGFSTTTYN